MKIRYLTFIGAAFALAMTGSTVVAQTSETSGTPEIEISDEGLKILCERFPLNSRCQASRRQETLVPSEC